MYLYYDSWDEEFKKPFGAITKGTKVVFKVKSDADTIYLHGLGEKISMEKNGEEFISELKVNLNIGLYFYSFEAILNEKIYRFGKTDNDGKAFLDGAEYQLTVHKNQTSPEWFKGKVMYQIYVDRFFKGSDSETVLRNNCLIHSSWDEKPIYIKNDVGEIVLWDFFGGNLDGIIKKLDYIDSLGVDIIYLNPIFEAVSNHKYDAADYSKVDMMYGTQNTLEKLVKKAGEYGIKIMLDGVFSHIGQDSIYFNRFKNYGESGAFNDKNSPFFSWFNFEEYPNKYESWWGNESLPCVNELDSSYLDFMLNEKDGIITRWMKAGIAGWRLDVADELPDEFIKRLKRTVLKVNPEAVLLGEVWEDASNKVSYDKRREYILGDSLDSVSNYPFRDALINLLKDDISSNEFSKIIMTLQENYTKDVFLSLMNMTGTHDTIRLFTLLGNAPDLNSINTWEQREYTLPAAQNEIAYKRLILYYIILYTMPGNPCIYYGDEICIQGYKDPYNRSTFDWDSDRKGIIKLIKKLSKLRKKMNVSEGFICFNQEKDYLCYRIKTPDNSYDVYINVSEKDIDIELEEIKTVQFSHGAKLEKSRLTLSKKSAIVLS
jgi:cyclomaltodextrinase / maltogenic alpha-amylase / neopullulanase